MGAYEAIDPKTQGVKPIYATHGIFNEAAVPTNWFELMKSKSLRDIVPTPAVYAEKSDENASSPSVTDTPVATADSVQFNIPDKQPPRVMPSRNCKKNGRAYSKYSLQEFADVGMYTDVTDVTKRSDPSVRSEAFHASTLPSSTENAENYFTYSFASESLMAEDPIIKLSEPRHPTLKKDFYPPAREIPLPKSLDDAKTSIYWPEWEAAYNQEINNLNDHETFKFEPEDKTKSKLGWKIVWKVKNDEFGEVTRFKVRIVVQGFKQIEMEHYDETFAPVAFLSTILLVLILSCALGLNLYLLDFLGAFLHSLMPDRFPVYIKTPPGLDVPDGFMVRLHKSLYGTRNAGHLWWKDLRKALLDLGYKQCPFDQCLFYKVTSDGTITFLVTWVDDVLIATNDPNIQKLKTLLEKMGFRIQTLEHLSWYLGLGIEITETHLVISQEAYIDKLLDRFGMTDCHAVSTPMDKYVFNVGASPPVTKGTPFRELLGGLNHLCCFSRPDGLFATFFLARYQSGPTIAHWNALKRVLRYFKGTKDLKLRFRRGKCLDKLVHIRAWCDADFAACKDTRRSTSGYIIQVNGAPIITKSRKQRLTAQSVCESETIAAQDCTKDLLWLRGIIQWIFPNDKLPPTDLNIDNQALIQIVNSQKNPAASKFFALRQYFLKEHKASGDINPVKIPTDDNLADIFTKPLGRVKFQYFRDQIFGV